jgi:hypothetical protein
MPIETTTTDDLDEERAFHRESAEERLNLALFFLRCGRPKVADPYTRVARYDLHILNDLDPS